MQVDCVRTEKGKTETMHRSVQVSTGQYKSTNSQRGCRKMIRCTTVNRRKY